MTDSSWEEGDGLYHIKCIEIFYPLFYIVNCYGEKCRDQYGSVVFVKREQAEEYCRKLNECPEGE